MKAHQPATAPRWSYRPFGDVFAGSFCKILVDTLGSPMELAPNDPRALIANSRAAAPVVNAALAPGCTEDVRKSQKGQKQQSLNGDWLLVDLGAGPWVWCLAAVQERSMFSFRLPGVEDAQRFQCELKRTGGGVWVLQDCPKDGRSRQLAAVCASSKKKGGCLCVGSASVDGFSIALVIPNVRNNNQTAQVFDDGDGGLWKKSLQNNGGHVRRYQGNVYVDNRDRIYIDLENDEKMILLSMKGEPRCGPWKFQFGAPLSLAQAMACVLVIARSLPHRTGQGWGARSGPALSLAGDAEEGAIRWPSYWAARGGSSSQLHCAPEAVDFMQKLISATFRTPKWTRDRGAGAIPSELQVLAVLRMENPDLWKRYQYRKNLLRRYRSGSVLQVIPPLRSMAMVDPAVLSQLDADVNESYLFHGTSPESASKIQDDGFNLMLAGAKTGKMFGGGVYFAEESAKSDEYAALQGSSMACFLFCRVTLGVWDVKYKPVNDMEHKLDRGSFDSVIGDRKAAVGTYREIIVYEEAHTYPEYIVIYNRCFADKPCARPRLIDTTGSGSADTIEIDKHGRGVCDTREPIPEPFLEHFKHVSGAVTEMKCGAEAPTSTPTSREDAGVLTSVDEDAARARHFETITEDVHLEVTACGDEELPVSGTSDAGATKSIPRDLTASEGSQQPDDKVAQRL